MIWPFFSLKLIEFLYLYNMSITCFFSVSNRQDLTKSMYVSNISLSYIFLLSSSCSSHVYFSFVSSFSFFNVFINLLNCSYKLSADSDLQYLLTFCCNVPALFYNMLPISNPISIAFFLGQILPHIRSC